MLERLPLVDVLWKPPRPTKAGAAGAASGKTPDDAEEAWEVEVELRRRRGGRGASRVHAPRFPKASLPLLHICRPGMHTSIWHVAILHGAARQVGPGLGVTWGLVCAQVKEEGWWLVLGDPDTDELLALKRLSFGGRTSTKLVFPVHDVGQQRTRLSLQLVSDSYAGLDQQFELQLTDEGR